MYISNNGNIGMATLLHNNKNCIKAHTNVNINVNNIREMGVISGSNILVSNATSSASPTVSGATVSVSNASSQRQNDLAASTGPGNSGGLLSSTVSGQNGGLITPITPTTTNNTVLPSASSQTLVITNNATGASSILTYQQYQQNILHQQSNLSHPRLLLTPNLVSLPITNVVNTGSPGIAVITTNNSSQQSNMPITVTNCNTTITNNTNNQNVYLHPQSHSHPTTSTNVNSFQQQFQQQIAASATRSGYANLGTLVPIQHQTQQQTALTVAKSKTNSNNNHQTALLISRNNNNNNNNNIGNVATQRLQHAILTKATSSKIQRSHIQQQSSIPVNNIALQHIVNSTTNSQLVNVVKAVNTVTTSATVAVALSGAKISPATTVQHHPYKQKSRSGSILTLPYIKQQTPSLISTTSQLEQQQQTQVGLSGKSQNITSITYNKKVQTINSIQQQQSPPPPQQQKACLANGHKINATTSSCKDVNIPSSTSSIKVSIATAASSSSSSTTSERKITPIAVDTITTTSKQFSYPLTKIDQKLILTNNNKTTTATTAIINTISKTITSAATNGNQISISNTNANDSFTNAVNSISSSIVPNTIANNISSVICDNNDTNNKDDSNNVSDSVESIQKSVNTEVTTEQEAEPEIDIVINNVVCSFSVRCHLNLREIALRGSNVEYRRENGMVTMKLRRPYTTASIWSSGRVTCTGATSEEQAKIAGRRYARCLQTLGFKVSFHNFRVVNVLGTCSMPWAIKIINFSEKYKHEASYEPELHPGVTYKLRSPKATLKIFSTGSITVTAASVLNVQAAIEYIYPLVYEFRKKRSPEELELLRQKQQHTAGLLDITDNDNEVIGNSEVNPTLSSTSTEYLKRRNDEYSKPIKKQCFKFIDTTKYSMNNNNNVDDHDVGSKIINNVTNGGNPNVHECDDEHYDFDDDDPRNLMIDDDIIAYDPNDIIEGPEDDFIE